MNRLILSLFLILTTGHKSLAASFDLNVFYFSDSLTAASTTGSTDTFFDGSVMINLDKKGQFIVGWSYGSYSVTTTAATNSTYSATEMGPRFGWYIDKGLEWGLFLTYNLQTTATYSTSSSETWRGTSMRAEFGYTPEVAETINIGLKLIYYAPSYSEKLVGSTTLSNVSYSRAIIYPSLATVFRW